MSEFARAAGLLAPLIAGGVFHGLCIKYRWLPALARPIDGGRKLKGRPLFGPNKTWRGPVAVGIGSAAGFLLRALFVGPGVPGEAAWLSQPGAPVLLFGFVAGFAAMLAELPNSLAKRQLGIGSGQQGRGGSGLLFSALDQVDMLIGLLPVLAFATVVTPALAAWSALILLVAHQGFTTLSYTLGMRATPR